MWSPITDAWTPVWQEVQAIFIDGVPIGGYEPSRTLGLLQQTERKDTIPSRTQIDLFLDKLLSGFLFFLSARTTHGKKIEIFRGWMCAWVERLDSSTFCSLIHASRKVCPGCTE